MTSWRSYVFPQKLLETTSPFNKHIRVNEEWGQMKLIVNGSPQSGAYVASLWKKAINHFSLVPFYPMRNILVLGVGGGTVITILHDEFPHASILGVDIDPVILGIAVKYFHIDDVPGVILVKDDAKKHIHRSVLQQKKYDAIIVDIFTGYEIPEFIDAKEFLLDIKKSLAKDGSVLINYLRELKYQEKSNEFMDTLQTIFPHVSDFPIANNRFFLAK